MHLLTTMALAAAVLATGYPAPAETPAYRYVRAGEPANVTVRPRPGFALMGGGTDLDEAFRFLCDHASGGDLLVLRATGDEEYNPYLRGLCHLNSVATLIVPNREAAFAPFVADAIQQASGIFIAGGDQANYINFWMNTPLESALNEAIRKGVPLGGTSAGLAVIGEYIYSAQADKPDDPNLDARTALANPNSARISLTRGFLDIPILKGIIFDTHFKRRDRMGRLLVFLARLNEPEARPRAQAAIRGIGVEERAAVLLEPTGEARIVGYGPAYFIDVRQADGQQPSEKPLTFGPVEVQKVAPGGAFYFKSWAGDSVSFEVSAKGGKLHSSQTANEIY